MIFASAVFKRKNGKLRRGGQCEEEEGRACLKDLSRISRLAVCPVKFWNFFILTGS